MLTLDKSYGYSELGTTGQHQIFHHEEAHQQKADDMNFRHMLCNHGNHAKPK